PPGAQAACEHAAPSESCVEQDINAVEYLAAAPEVRREHDEVIHPSELGWRDVVEAADPIPATAGKPRIRSCRDAVGIEVGRSYLEIIDEPDVAIPGAVIAGREAEARLQFMLDDRRAHPELRRDSPALRQI